MELVELNSMNQQHQERAVDVPESFIAVVKQAPRYPPPANQKQQTLNRLDNRMNMSNEKLRLNYNQNININNNKVGYEPEKLLKYSEEIERKKKSHEEFLRSSLRSSVKLNGRHNSTGRHSSTHLNEYNKNAIVNSAFEDEDYFDLNNSPNLNLVLTRLQKSLNDNRFDSLVEQTSLNSLLNTYQTVIDNQKRNKIDPMTNLSNDSAINLLFEVICVLRSQDDPSCNQETLELFIILTDKNFQNLFSIFEEVCKTKRQLNSFINTDQLISVHDNQKIDDVKIVNLKKTNCEPLGITIKNDLDGAVVVGRIVKGGTADKSGLMNEGDEIIEINGIELRGRNVNQICDMMADINGTLTFIVAPKDPLKMNMHKNTFVHLKALFDYDPEDDIYIPCRELGICFSKGDILHVIDQTDPNWWQAFKEGEHEQNLAGLIPSIYFQIQREQMKKSLTNDTDSGKYKSKKSVLCGMKRKKKNLTSDMADEILTYEEIHLYYPKANIKRPVVLIGPTNIGRHELRQRIMLDTERFSAAVPHTSRNRRDGEMDGVDYHFITRSEFELYIRQGKFVEQGQFQGNYYGTSLGAIEAVVQSGKICLLNLHVQSIHILRQSSAGAKLKPFFVFVSPPPQLDKLNKLISITTNNTFENSHISNKDLQSIIEEAKEIENKFGHYFDMILTMTDIDRAYHELIQKINALERVLNNLMASKKRQSKSEIAKNALKTEVEVNESKPSELVKSTAGESINSKSSTKWLIANQQKIFDLNTFTSCVCLADLNGDEDYRLIIGDFGSFNRDDQKTRLLVFKGTSIQAQIKLTDYPIAVTSFYMDQNDLNVPSISVASGNAIYIYKNLKPFYKFTLPPSPINSLEQELWNTVQDKLIDTTAFRVKLFELRKQFGESALTAKSQSFLDLNETNIDQLEKFIADYRDEPLRKLNLITCMNTIKKSVTQEKQVCYLVVGTEDRDLIIIEPDAFTIVSSVKLPSIPVFIEVSGGFDVEYRITVNCRDAHIYTIKRNLKQPRLSVQLTSQCCSMVKMNSNIVVACIDNTLNCYNSKGNCLWSNKQPAAIRCMVSINIEMFSVRMIAVALANKQIIFFNEKNIFDTLQMDEVICSMRFGRFGREDNTLILIGESGQLTVMILKRTAKFYNLEPANKNTIQELATNTTKLNIPKKTKFFVDQTMRERENSILIHRTFQQDLYRLKLISSRAYVKAINSCLNPISSNNSHPIKLSVQIHGLGPIFKLVLELQNISVDQPSINLFMTLKCNPKIYRIASSLIFVPFISPAHNYTFQNKVELISDLSLTESIKIYVCKKDQKVPLITAICNLPKSEAL